MGNLCMVIYRRYGRKPTVQHRTRLDVESHSNKIPPETKRNPNPALVHYKPARSGTPSTRICTYLRKHHYQPLLTNHQCIIIQCLQRQKTPRKRQQINLTRDPWRLVTDWMAGFLNHLKESKQAGSTSGHEKAQPTHLESDTS